MRPRLVRVASVALALALALAPAQAPAQGPPPTPVPPDGSPSPYPQHLETPEPSDRPPRLSAPSYALIDLDTGRALHDRRSGRRRPVASLTKILTVLLVLEETAPDDVVTVSPAAAAQGGAVLGLEAGEEIAVEELVYALMLQSSNDAAVAVAEHVAGSVDRFVRRLNRRARELGLADTRFRSPGGLDDAGFSTASDMARIAREALEHPAFAEAARTRVREIPSPRGPPRVIQSRNALLWLSEGAVGVKTGFTSAAGFCLAGAAERDGVRLAAVVLGAPQEAFTDTAALLDHGFANWRPRTLVEEGERLAPVVVDRLEVPVVAEGEIVAVLHDDEETVRVVEATPGLELPIGGGDRVGEVAELLDGREVGRVSLVAAETVEAPPDFDEVVEAVADSVANALSELLASIF